LSAGVKYYFYRNDVGTGLLFDGIVGFACGLALPTSDEDVLGTVVAVELGRGTIGTPRGALQSAAERAAKLEAPIPRSLADLGSLRGATPAEIRSLIPKDWVELPLKKGSGVRFLNPARPGEAIMLEDGWAGATDPLHSGPYLRISRNGQIVRIPLAGNPAL